MPGKSGSSKRKLRGAALVRLPVELAERIEATARATDLSVAAWLRRLAVEATGSTPELARPTPPREPPPPPAPEHVRQLCALAHRIGELGGAMVQAAIVTRQAGREALHTEIEAALPEVRAVSARVLAAIDQAWPR